MGILKKLFGQKKESSPEENHQGVKTSSEKKTTNNASALKFDGLKALQTGNIKFARLALEQALALSPEFETRFYYAQSLQSAGLNEEALEQYNLLLEEIPEHLSARVQRASLRLKQELYLEALEDLKPALLLTDIPEELALVYRLQTQAFLGLSRYDEAIKAVDKADASLEGDVKILLLKSRTLILLDKYEEAMTLIQQAKIRFPEEECFLLYEAAIKEKEDDDCAAESLFRQVLELDPFNEEAIMGLVRIFREAEEPERAIGVLSEFTDSCNASLELRKLYIEILRENGREEKANEIEAATIGGQVEMGKASFDNLYKGGIF